MDIVSHGLWGGLAFGRKNKKSFWTAAAFGIAPDFLAFGPFFVSIFLGLRKLPDIRQEPPDPSLIPSYISHVYNATHSLIVFLIAFLIIWAIFKKPLWEMSAWGLHILMDIPTHSHVFFPTPFLWPISGLEVNGIPWSHPIILFPDIILLAALYAWFFLFKKRTRSATI
ncbi:hypothetical protein A2662_01900 [Candidatus Giovannonibacteria bacterium RIFCSPHIGHO2_01_FULL_45_33]|uniref:Uncharacterized protein n=1 Tax=Candidatus Giovannonibacteria bacterium RIFCSPLOWO2_01_FULL_45_34 TaxID=1798351 RepID=A0A1F5WZH9_9BACT|nr:MAG: hypothetical protein A2662_01900 [Candidatus Giovannonibacteria bacterium RIFCSPHIGHO2_01_FULL_45_33]OGF69040.1 MAG: hypothetical protein A3C73_00750 [Candidatus Giovannonibacteria bacterium RIFCSPHIGHO2_02_FULL_44_11]OGF81044.1 MAG: hypothetical protein A2930_03240 [Candidatus Giovannonibacteria bacterium RIFCSPLOWO2_01_FULL_45_34]